MANISSAYGSLSFNNIEEWTDEQIEDAALVLFSNVMGPVAYYGLGFDYDFNEFVDAIKKENYVGFYGSGRWSFYNNLSSFEPWTTYKTEEDYEENFRAFNFPKKYDTLKSYNEARQRVKEHFLNNEDHNIYIEYKDLETGCGFIEVGEVSIGTTLDSNNEMVFDIDFLSSDTYESTLKNTCEIYDEDDELLYQTVYDILSYLFDENKSINKFRYYKNVLFDYIKSDSKWFDLWAYMFIDNEDDIPDPIKDYIKKEGWSI